MYVGSSEFSFSTVPWEVLLKDTEQDMLACSQGAFKESFASQLPKEERVTHRFKQDKLYCSLETTRDCPKVHVSVTYGINLHPVPAAAPKRTNENGEELAVEEEADEREALAEKAKPNQSFADDEVLRSFTGIFGMIKAKKTMYDNHTTLMKEVRRITDDEFMAHKFIRMVSQLQHEISVSNQNHQAKDLIMENMNLIKNFIQSNLNRKLDNVKKSISRQTQSVHRRKAQLKEKREGDIRFLYRNWLMKMHSVQVSEYQMKIKRQQKFLNLLMTLR